jgi:thiol-disulfide isomerase/thioredoxin
VKRYFMALLIAGLACAGGWWLGQGMEPLSAADEAAIALQIQDWAATQKLIASKKGKVVVVDAWSTSCLPCIKEFPNLVALQKQFASDVACVSVSLDYSGRKDRPPEYYKEKVLKFLTKQNATFDNVLSSEPTEQVLEKIGVPAIPAVFVYDRAGKLVKTFDNSDAATEEEGFTYQDVTALVESLLKK